MSPRSRWARVLTNAALPAGGTLLGGAALDWARYERFVVAVMVAGKAQSATHCAFGPVDKFTVPWFLGPEAGLAEHVTELVYPRLAPNSWLLSIGFWLCALLAVSSVVTSLLRWSTHRTGQNAASALTWSGLVVWVGACASLAGWQAASRSTAMRFGLCGVELTAGFGHEPLISWAPVELHAATATLCACLGLVSLVLAVEVPTLRAGFASLAVTALVAGFWLSRQAIAFQTYRFDDPQLDRQLSEHDSLTALVAIGAVVMLLAMVWSLRTPGLVFTWPTLLWLLACSLAFAGTRRHASDAVHPPTTHRTGYLFARPHDVGSLPQLRHCDASVLVEAFDPQTMQLGGHPLLPEQLGPELLERARRIDELHQAAGEGPLPKKQLAFRVRATAPMPNAWLAKARKAGFTEIIILSAVESVNQTATLGELRYLEDCSLSFELNDSGVPASQFATWGDLAAAVDNSASNFVLSVDELPPVNEARTAP